MLILPLALLVGALAGWARRGSWRALSEVKFQYAWLIACAIGAQAALSLPALTGWLSGERFALLVVTYFVAGWWLFANARASSGGVRCGLGLLAGGWFLNFLAILLNGGMPVSESALRQAGFAASTSVRVGHLSKHVLADPNTVLRALGDVIPLPWFRSVISPGDSLMAVGIVILVAAAMSTSARIDSASSRLGAFAAGSDGRPLRDQRRPEIVATHPCQSRASRGPK